MNKSIYLDYAAATPMDTQVFEAMRPFLTEKFYNPSAQYLAAQEVSKAVAAAREKVAHWLGVRSSEIVFTSGGTESNNLAVHGLMRRYPDANLIVSAIEHDSMLAPARQYAHKEVQIRQDGLVDLEDLERKIDDHTVLVSVMYANNEIGTIQPLKRVAQIIDAVRKHRKEKGSTLPLYLHTDACQAANYLDLHVARLGADMMTINAGKIYGPKQSGALYIRAGIELEPQILGGGQERGQRSGTEGVANLIGLATALDIAQDMRHDEVKRLQELQRLFMDLLAQKILSATVNGSRTHRLPNNVHITIPGTDNERLIFGLDEEGILCAAGSACSASKEEASHVLKGLGLDEESSRSSLRFTMGRQTDETAVRRSVEMLAQLI